MGYASLLLNDGDTLEAIHIAHMEKGIKDAHDNLDGIEVSLKGTREENGREIKVYEMTLPNGKIFDFEVKNGKDGEKGDAGNVTIDNRELRFFVGTKAEYDALDDQTNVFAIITDDPTQIGLIDKINGFIDGSIPIPNIEQTYVRKDSLGPRYAEIFQISGPQDVWLDYEFRIGTLPDGKNIEDIMGIGFEMELSLSDSKEAPYWFDFSANKVHKYAIDPELPPTMWHQEVRFQASSICGTNHGFDPSSIGVSVMSVLLSEKDGDIYAKFLDGLYSTLGGSVYRLMQYAHPLPSHRFIIRSFCYWFA